MRTFTTPTICIVWQLSGSSDSWCKAWAVAWWTRGFSLWRYLTSGATAPSLPKAVRLLPQAQQRAIASARCRRRRSFWVLVNWASVGTTPWSVITAKFSSSRAMLAIAAQTELDAEFSKNLLNRKAYLRTSVRSDLRSETMSSRPPTKLRTISPASRAFSMQGQIAQAAEACTSGFVFLRRDQSSRTPSFLSICSMLSFSRAHAPTAFVTLTSRSWFVPVRRSTRGGIPPDFRMVVRIAGTCAHSARAPTTFTRTSSGWFSNKLTSCSTVFSS